MKSKIVVFDIDGVLARLGDRLKYISSFEKDYEKFYQACDEDKPIKKMFDFLDGIAYCSSISSIIFCTGRAKYDGVEQKTRDWLEKHIGYPVGENNLIMREANDPRPDFKVKPEMLMRHLSKLEYTVHDIAFIIEDRDRMVARWRELGFLCLQFGEK